MIDHLVVKLVLLSLSFQMYFDSLVLFESFLLRWPTAVTAKYNSSRQNKIGHGKLNIIHHGKTQFETTNSNYSRQTTNTHGKNKNNYCNSKFIKARAKRSPD